MILLLVRIRRGDSLFPDVGSPTFTGSILVGRRFVGGDWIGIDGENEMSSSSRYGDESKPIAEELHLCIHTNMQKLAAAAELLLSVALVPWAWWQATDLSARSQLAPNAWLQLDKPTILRPSTGIGYIAVNLGCIVPTQQLWVPGNSFSARQQARPMGVAELLFKFYYWQQQKTKNCLRLLHFSLSLFILLMCGGILPVCPIHYVTHPSGKSEA